MTDSERKARKREYQRRWRKKNRNKVAAIQRKYLTTHKGKDGYADDYSNAISIYTETAEQYARPQFSEIEYETAEDIAKRYYKNHSTKEGNENGR